MHESQQQVVEHGGREASRFMERVVQDDLRPGAAVLPPGWAGHGDGRRAAGPRAGQ